MNVQVRILNAGLPLAEVGQQAKLVVFEDRGFKTASGSADQERIDVGSVAHVEKGTIIGLNLAGDTQIKGLVGRTQKEALVPTRQDRPSAFAALASLLQAFELPRAL